VAGRSLGDLWIWVSIVDFDTVSISEVVVGNDVVYLVLPFSILLEFAAAFGFLPWVVVTSLISATSWATLLYIASALVIRLRRVA